MEYRYIGQVMKRNKIYQILSIIFQNQDGAKEISYKILDDLEIEHQYFEKMRIQDLQLRRLRHWRNFMNFWTINL